MLLAKSYAKLNLGLRVLRRRDDGYHDIQTGFVFINWFDKLEIESAKETSFRCNKPDVPSDESNLILKALALLRKETGKKLNVRIQLSKSIPMGAGLGGGSSNAALTLRMLNQLENLGYSEAELAALGARLGADVPVFIHGQCAIGSGIGDALIPADIQPDAWIITVFPNEHSSTADAYRFCAPYEDEALDVIPILTQSPIDEWPTFLVNDLEPPVMEILPIVGDLKDNFYDSGAIFAAMSGSGSSVFGLFDMEHLAFDCFEYLKAQGYAVNLTLPNFAPDHRIHPR
jgi:4-diphosphocytidyl-2-C-methyl-D-erythritol kinase